MRRGGGISRCRGVVVPSKLKPTLSPCSLSVGTRALVGLPTIGVDWNAATTAYARLDWIDCYVVDSVWIKAVNVTDGGEQAGEREKERESWWWVFFLFFFVTNQSTKSSLCGERERGPTFGERERGLCLIFEPYLRLTLDVCNNEGLWRLIKMI